ncbi:efflux RND transporter periplasmic adaptor subunit [Candidatus Ichthyocystis hellenicum]|uniref:efflux RND transporter periplasmic adaptor subunit n=1 Tax=Candidatus Ichthyocystis hellenicum TaxID=1561003 RepID=UPI001584718B|nr:efflux RND transporter periplasmic adaptor subunit [Candidatus Ichthyocystis hellenicum]
MLRRILLLGVMTIFGLVACQNQDEPEEGTTPPLVSVVRPEISHRLTHSYTYFGRVVPNQSSILSFRVPGHIEKRHTEVGRSVNHGDLLFELSDQDYQAASQAANYIYQAASEQFEAASADYKSSQKLYNDHFITKPDLNRRHAKLLMARGEMFRAKAKHTDAQSRLSDTRLLAPYSGTITKIMAEEGQNVGPGTPVAVIARKDNLDIAINVPQNDIEIVQHLSKCQIRIDYKNGKKSSCSGQISKVGSDADPMSNTYQVTVSLDKCDAPIRLGMTGSIIFSKKSEEGSYFIVPITSVSSDEKKGNFVLVLEKNKLHKRFVSIIENDDDNHYIIKSNDLSPSNEIVTGPLFILHENQTVRVTREISNEKLSH